MIWGRVKWNIGEQQLQKKSNKQNQEQTQKLNNWKRKNSKVQKNLVEETTNTERNHPIRR